jgi:hypothetical protein
MINKRFLISLLLLAVVAGHREAQDDEEIPTIQDNQEVLSAPAVELEDTDHFEIPQPKIP